MIEVIYWNLAVLIETKYSRRCERENAHLWKLAGEDLARDIPNYLTRHSKGTMI
jgi:hypothetical protein